MGFIMDITQGRRLCQGESRIKLKDPETKERKFEVLVKSAEQVAVFNWAATTGKLMTGKCRCTAVLFSCHQSSCPCSRAAMQMAAEQVVVLVPAC